MSTRCNRWFLLQILLLAQHVSGTIMPIIRSSRESYKWLLPVVFGAWFSSCWYGVELRVLCPVCGLLQQLENQAQNTTGSNHLYDTLELLMMVIMVPETCWASSKICNKNHLLHLVDILFPNMGLSEIDLDVKSSMFSCSFSHFQLLFKPANGCTQIISFIETNETFHPKHAFGKEFEKIFLK